MDTIPKTLFRGDRFGNPTKPELYRTNGLLTKQINSGDPAYIQKNGLLKSIEDHISPINKNNFYNSSYFLSFTDERQIADFYCSYGQIDNLQKCDNHFETNYIFTFRLDRCQLIKRDDLNGIYSFTYSCDTNLIEPDSPHPFDLSAHEKVCEYCRESDSKKHSFVLINAFIFLYRNRKFCRDENSLSNAKRDHEWLIFPTDYILRLQGYSSRIPRSSIWEVEHYYLASKGKRDMYKIFEMGGIIL